MWTFINGMAVLVVRIVFVILSYQILKTINWRNVFTERNYYMAQWVCILLSIAIGHLVSSFFIEIIQLVQDMVLSLIY